MSIVCWASKKFVSKIECAGVLWILNIRSKGPLGGIPSLTISRMSTHVKDVGTHDNDMGTRVNDMTRNPINSQALGGGITPNTINL